MGICPNYKNKEVFTSFNAIVEAFGGKPMTEEEFSNGTLRDQRTGTDLNAMETAYELWDLNNGMPLQYTPFIDKNGNPIESKLFKSLLDEFKGSVSDAIVAKAKVYTGDFINQFGDWINDPTNASKVVDENGEPLKSAIDNIGTFSTTDDNIYDQKVLLAAMECVSASAQEYFGNKILNQLNNGNIVSSQQIIQAMIDNGIYNITNTELSKLLSVHDIPVKFGKLGPNELASTITDDNGGSIIIINPNLINFVTSGFMATTMLHEVIHAITVNAINNPKTEEEIQFVKANSKLYQILNNALDPKLYSRNDVQHGYYALTNEKEFAAAFATDEVTRSAMYDAAYKLDEVQRNKFFTRIKNFINVITNLFIGKDVFKTNTQKLQDYQRIVNDYLNNVDPIKEGSILDISDLKEFAQNINYSALRQDSAIRAQKQHNFLRQYYESNNQIIGSQFDGILQSLETRLLAIKNSILNEARKAEEYQSTQNAIYMIENSYVSTFVAMKNIADSVSAQIMRDMDYLNDEINTKGTISFEEYQYHMHSNFGTWAEVLDKFNQIYANKKNVQALIQEANDLLPEEEQKITEDDVKTVLDTINRVKFMCLNNMNSLSLIRNAKVKQSLSKIGKTVGAEDIDDFVEAMYETIPSINDISQITKNFAAADSVNIPAIRALTNIVGKIDEVAENKAQDKTIELFNLQKALTNKRDIMLLYELDQNGRKSGYLTRSLNYGKFYQEYDDMLIDINRKIGKKYNLPIEDSNRLAPEQEDARIEWNLLKEDWLSKYCHRKYVPEYYKAWAKVSQSTKEQLQSITSMIKAINQKQYEGSDGKMHSIIDENGIPRYEHLTDEDWETLNELIIRKNRLRSLYDINGVKKVGDALKTAEELQQLYNELYKQDGKNSRQKRVDDWAKARLNMIYDCGGKNLIDRFGGEEQFIKYMRNDEDSTFDYSGFENAINDVDNNFERKRFQRWDDRNSRFEFRTDDEGNALVFNQIELATGGIKPNYGEEYDALNKELHDKLSVYYGKSGYIRGSKIPNALKKDLRDIQKKMNEIKRNKLKSDKTLLAVSKAYGKIFDSYIKFVDTAEFKQQKSEILQKVEGDYMMYTLMLSKFGVTDYRQDLPILRPYRWFQTMEARDKHTYMHYSPGDAWVDPDSGTKFDNPKFDHTQESSMVPLKKYYDNSARFNAIQNNKQLKKLYDAVYNTIKESNAKQSNRQYADNYLLPQVLGNVFDRMDGRNFFDFKNGDWYALWINGGDTKFSMLWNAFKQHLGFRSENDDTIFGSEWNLDSVDNIGKTINSNKPKRYASTMPDGSPYRAIPQYYTRKMDDPSQISSHLLSIVLSYYHMSCAFEEKAKKKAEIDTILEDLKSMRFIKGDDIVGGKNQAESNVYQMARQYIDADFYNIRMKDTNSANDTFSWSKFASTFQRWTTARNLGLNPKVAATGFLTSSFAHITNALIGYKYSTGDARRGALDVMRNILGIISNAGTHYANNEMVLLAEMFNISDQFDKKIKDSGYNPLTYTINNNFLFGMLSSMDFITKASIMSSVLHSFRYVDGEFITSGDLKMMKYKLGKDGYKNKLKAWKKAKTLRSCLHKNKDGNRIICDPQYEDAFKKIQYVVKKRCIKYAEHADGMATKSQKAQIMQNWYGGFILLHRQYLPLMIQERFGETVYDYDIQQYKNGQFRRLYRFFMEIAMHNMLTATLSGAAITSIVASSPLAILSGAIIADVIRRIKSKNSSKLVKQGLAKKDIRSLKDKLNDFKLNDFTTKENNINSQLNRNALKQIAIEVVLYKAFICPFVGALCMWADDDPDNAWKQMLAYWFRGLQWEYYTPYRFDDILNNIKTPSAATGLIDDIKNTVMSAFNTANPMFYEMQYFLMSLLGWSSFEQPGNIEDENLIVNKRDKVYGGDKKIKKVLIKTTPYRNIKEQTIDSKSKRKYFENQVMGKDNLEGWISSETIYNNLFNW